MGEIEARKEAVAFGKFLRQSNSVEAKIDTLARIGSRNFIDPDNDDKLFARIAADIARTRPFSVVRLGDGEGNVLFWGERKREYPELARFSMDSIWHIMFGREAPFIDLYDRLYERVSIAARNADYLGIPFVEQDEHSISLMCDPAQDYVGPRGNMGQAAVWDWVSQHCAACIDSEDCSLVNAHFHTSLACYLDPVLGQAGNLSVITCHAGLLERFGAQFGIEKRFNFLIPPQFLNVGKLPDRLHFPDRFDEIDSTLAGLDLTGCLFFVGAGIAGKAYCDRIKRQGGMAIDAGSMMDVWMGIGVRQYQDTAYVNRYKLTSDDDHVG